MQALGAGALYASGGRAAGATEAASAFQAHNMTADLLAALHMEPVPEAAVPAQLYRRTTSSQLDLLLRAGGCASLNPSQAGL